MMKKISGKLKGTKTKHSHFFLDVSVQGEKVHEVIPM